MATGIVKFFKSEKGWGAIASDELPGPGDAFVHFSVIEAPGYRELAAGDTVDFDFEPARQDSFRFVATRARRLAPGPAPTLRRRGEQVRIEPDGTPDTDLTPPRTLPRGAAGAVGTIGVVELSGAVVVVTGASSGIGAATARALGRAGASVVLLARRADRIEALAAELPDAVAVPCDVTEPEQVARAVDTALAAYGRIDVLVNNAGQGVEVPVAETDLDDFRAVLELNLVAPLALMQAVVPAMRRQGAGTIVNVSSGATLAPFPGTGPYAASKAALNHLSAVARAELADAGITVSVVLPSLTRTEFFDVLRGPARADSQDLDDASTPEEVADVIVGLVRSGEARADLVPVELGGTYRG